MFFVNAKRKIETPVLNAVTFRVLQSQNDQSPHFYFITRLLFCYKNLEDYHKNYDLKLYLSYGLNVQICYILDTLKVHFLIYSYSL